MPRVAAPLKDENDRPPFARAIIYLTHLSRGGMMLLAELPKEKEWDFFSELVSEPLMMELRLVYQGILKSSGNSNDSRTSMIFGAISTNN